MEAKRGEPEGHLERRRAWLAPGGGSVTSLALAGGQAQSKVLSVIFLKEIPGGGGRLALERLLSFGALGAASRAAGVAGSPSSPADRALGE